MQVYMHMYMYKIHYTLDVQTHCKTKLTTDVYSTVAFNAKYSASQT